MKTNYAVIFFLLFCTFHCLGQTPSFSIQDTVCINTPVTISNTSVGASTYYWNFCVADINTIPTGDNLGNIGGTFSGPVFFDYVFDGTNYYGFQTNNWSGNLIRLDFGNSLLNMPTATNLGSVGGVIPKETEGIQVIKNEGKWYALIIGGDPTTAGSSIAKIEFGSNISNNSPIGTNWGNIGNLSYPHDLYLFEDNGNWYGLTVNAKNNTITRFNFTSSFSNIPTGTNLGNLVNLNYPTGICAIKENNNWYAFVGSADNSSLTRLSFGSSLLNTPTAQNLGNINGAFRKPWDIQILKYCQQNVGFIVDAQTGELLRLDFGSSITNTPAITNYGSIGNLNFPHCLSRIFRVGPDLYTFVSNVNTGTLSRIKFSGCTNSSMPSSNSASPPPISYNSPGVYNINLTIDDGLPTQASLCKQIVVLAPPSINPMGSLDICPGTLTTLSPIVSGATKFSWSPVTGLNNPNITNPVASPTTTSNYVLTASNAGCSSNSTVTVNVLPAAQCTPVTPSFITPDTVCVNTPVSITNTTIGASSYYWNFCVADLNATPQGTNIGNPGNLLSLPVFIDYTFFNGNYYGFLVNYKPGNLIRLDFGNSLLNTPTAVSLGNFGGIIPAGEGAEGIQLVNNEGRWYAIIVGGWVNTGSTPRILKIDFGNDLTNPTPTATNWGNLGNMSQPIDLHVFKEGNNWYGFTVNAENNTITRFNFTNSFNNVPTAINLGNIGNLAYPTGIYAINDNGFWRVFVVNGGDNTRSSGTYSLTRLDFGTSLLNTPTGVNLGNPGNMLQHPRDFTIMKMCNQIVGFAVNGHFNNSNLIRFDFNNNLSSVPSVTSLGNIGSFNFPHSISKLFRVNNDVYGFVTNVANNTITRIKIDGCNSSNISGSSLQTPPPVVYNSPGIYNINLTVDDGLPTQAAVCKQVVVLAPPVHTPTRNFTICRGESFKIGSSVKSASYLWNTGATSDSIDVNSDGIYWIESTTPWGCSVRDSFIVSFAPPPPLDFGFQQNMCFPKTVQFSSKSAGVQSYLWNFGDGQTNNNSSSPSVTYADYGNYNIKLNVQYPSGCLDSISKQITVTNSYDQTLLLNSDTTICLGDSLLLNTIGSLGDYCWKTSLGTVPTSLTAYVKPTLSTIYTLTSQVVGQNLVTNADFSLGNTGFSSEYIYATSNNTEGQYSVGSSPIAWNAYVSNCQDHTSGNGNMLMVNGSPKAGVKVWTQSFTVNPNTNYNFSVWISSLHTNNPGSLYFAINNAAIGNNINAGTSTCQWKQFFSTWNSGNNTTATISIVNNNTIVDGNDFALDDIFFGEVTTKTDSVMVNVVGLCDSVKISGKDKVCSPADTLTYSIYKSPNCTQQYSIRVDNSFATILSQTATSLKLLFKKNGTTTIRVAYANNCKIAADSIDVSIKFSPTTINFGPNITTCRDTSFVLNAGDGFVSYSWQDGSKDSTFNINVPGNYKVMAQNLCGLKLEDSIKYIKSFVTPFTVSPLNAKVCEGDSLQFAANGGTTYAWSPAGNFSHPNTAASKAFVNATQNFAVFIADSVCKRDTTIIVPVTASPGANIVVTKSNDVNCGNDSASLVATGGVSYTWSPDLFISKKYENRIIVKLSQTITYTVKGKDETGCIGEDSVTVFFFKTGDQKLYMPTAFTPNGDGKNDVFRPTFIGPSAKYDFSIYSRWGQLVYRSKVPGAGWDGTVNGVPQKADVYVFYVTAEGGCNGKFEQKGTFALIR